MSTGFEASPAKQQQGGGHQAKQSPSWKQQLRPRYLQQQQQQQQVVSVRHSVGNAMGSGGGGGGESVNANAKASAWQAAVRELHLRTVRAAVIGIATLAQTTRRAATSWWTKASSASCSSPTACARASTPAAAAVRP